MSRQKSPARQLLQKNQITRLFARLSPYDRRLVIELAEMLHGSMMARRRAQVRRAL